MYAQNPMFSGVSPGRMAEARRFAQGGQMGRAKQQFELGGGQWNPQVHRMIGQQDSFGSVIGGPPQPGPPPIPRNNWVPDFGGGSWNGPAPPGFTHGGGMSTMALEEFRNPTTGETWTASHGGYQPPPGWERVGGPGFSAKPGGGFGGGMRQPGFVTGGPDDPAMGGSGYMTRPGIGAFPNIPPRFKGGSPAGMNQIRRDHGAFGGRPSAGPPIRRVLY